MKIDGQCHCGSVRYEAEIDPERVSVCHCNDCQVLTGSPYRISVRTARENIRVTSGEPRVYVKTAESGNRRRQYFCPECGSPLFASNENPSGDWGIRWGSIRQRRELQPKRQFWCRSALSWTDMVNGLPGRETQKARFGSRPGPRRRHGGDVGERAVTESIGAHRAFDHKAEGPVQADRPLVVGVGGGAG